MPVTITSISDVEALDFDEIIDVRSPAEHAEDHLPGAISLPVLDNEERARVGRIYVQESPFRARKIGAALVARNVARHLEETLADRPGGWRPLVYCWRGGQRSGAMAAILREVGWRVETLAGGYRAWRRAVVAALYEEGRITAPVVLIDGNTGTAKTALLARLAAAGAQVIDLEGMAGHRGSVFGGLGAQPSQKAFEGTLALALSRIDPGRPLVLEAESSRIGALSLPPAPWAAMRAAPRIVLDAPLEARAAFLARAYADIAANRDGLARLIGTLGPLHPRDRVAAWQALALAGETEALAGELMARHYDPAYARHRARNAAPAAVLSLPDLSDAALDAAVPELLAEISRLSAG
ncbi:MAG: tRNA 2-selenouridine(34) synthase MnmH [Rhodobacteraceae bacterium]|nr:tRNA 2-selenouridine(34) synthase MnmH [Paracoccaceae bacterium]